MHFVDECHFRVEAGNGGDGAIAFRREKFVPFGGPAGGDGGDGGSVVFIGDPGKNTLSDLTHRRILQAESGKNGEGKDKYGRGGRDLELRVPLGTIVYDDSSGERLGELTQPDSRLVVARGGKGGKGNKHFATPVDRAPKRAEPGGPGEERDLRLELKVMADVGLLGFPNVGKSTFISSVSAAKPKVADYPFTTLEPHLGVVRMGDYSAGLGTSFVMADIPGLVPGASEGQGLGHRFLRHVERTRVLLHLVSLTQDPERDPIADYRQIRTELERFSQALTTRPELVALSMADLPDVQAAYAEWQQRFRDELGIELHLLSSVTRKGVDEILKSLQTHLRSSEPA